MQPRSVSPAATADQNAEHQQQEPDRAATPPPPPPPKDIYATLASTLAQPMDAEQYYQCVLRELSASHATLQGWRQAKMGDNEWGPEDNLLWENTWKSTMDTFLEAAAMTYPCPPEDTRHALHALLAFHSWKPHHTITLRPLDHNPHQWTPEDGATTAISIQQDPENPSGCHLTWNDPASHPSRLPQPPRRLRHHQRKNTRRKSPRTTRKRDAPGTPPSNRTGAPPERAPHPPHHQNGAPPTTPHHPGSQRISEPTAGIGSPQRHVPVGPNHTGAPGHPPPLNHRTHQHLGTTGRPPPPPPHHPRRCRHHANERRPHNDSPRPSHPHTPTTSSAPMTVHPGPTPWQAIVIAYPSPKPHTHTPCNKGGRTSVGTSSRNT